MRDFSNIYIEDLLSKRHAEEAQVDLYRRAFSEAGIVKISDFFAPAIFEDLKSEVEGLLKYAKRRDFIMGGYDSPRNMSVVGGKTIFEHSRKLAALYTSAPIVHFLSELVGRRLHLSQQEDAFMTINHLEHHQDTQGWHLDDGAPAVIYALSSPSAREGGSLEFISNWPDFRSETDPSGVQPICDCIEEARTRGVIETVHLEPNSMYVLQSDTALHRVTPLIEPSQSRTVLAAGYEMRSVGEYSNTGSDLYEGA